MKKLLLITVLASSIQGCAIWDWIKPASSGISVDTEITANDKKEEINTEVTGKKRVTNNTADVVYNTYQEVNEQYPFWVLVLLVLGWVSPTPSQMWRSLVNLISRRNKK